MSTSEQINGEELPDEERKELLRGEPPAACATPTGRAWTRRSGTSTRRSSWGAPPQGLREDNELGELRNRPSFNDLLKRYE